MVVSDGEMGSYGREEDASTAVLLLISMFLLSVWML